MKTNPSFIILILLISTLACSLTAEPLATLPPRTPMSTLTPQSPIGPSASVQSVPGGTQIANQPPQLPTFGNGNTQNLPISPIIQQIQLVDGNRMWNTIVSLIGFQNRHALSEPRLDIGVHAAGNYLYTEFRNIADQNPTGRIDVQEHQFTFVYGAQEYPGRNILMTINGTDVGAGVILVTAHFDTINFSSPANTTSYQPGANDNGSGVAAVLEMARIMAQRPHRATIIFVLFSSEELNRDGSVKFRDEYLLPLNIPIRAVINLDIIGSPTGPTGARYDNQMRVFSDPTTNSNSRQLARLAHFSAQYFVPGMTVNVEKTIDRPGRWGDHETFSNVGWSAIRLIEQSDDPNLVHTAKDTLDDIDPAYLQRTTQVALATLMILADGPEPPADMRIDAANGRIDWLPSRGAVSYVLVFKRADSLTYDQVIPVNGTSIQWPQIITFESVAIAAIDENGQVGPFSTERLIPIQ